MDKKYIVIVIWKNTETKTRVFHTKEEAKTFYNLAKKSGDAIRIYLAKVEKEEDLPLF